MKKIIISIGLLMSASSFASTTVCTAMCSLSWSTFGAAETGNKFVSVIGKGENEASAQHDMGQKCKSFNPNAKLVLGFATSNSRDSDYVSVTSVPANRFSCIEL